MGLNLHKKCIYTNDGQIQSTFAHGNYGQGVTFAAFFGLHDTVTSLMSLLPKVAGTVTK